MVEFFVVLLSGLVAISNLALAKPCNPKFNYAVKEVHNPPRQWTRVKDAPKDSMLLLRIGLKMDRWDELERHLYEGRCYSNATFVFDYFTAKWRAESSLLFMDGKSLL